MMKRYLLLLPLLSGTLLPAEPVRFDYEVRPLFFAGFAGNAESLARGMKLCETILASDPKDAEALVWHGAGLFFQAGAAFQKGDQQTGMARFQQGRDEMDRAVAIAPNKLAVRVPRGAVLLQATLMMPPQVAKPLLERGVEDYEVALAPQEARIETLSAHQKGELLFGLANGYRRLGDEQKAKQYFLRVLAELPNTEYARRTETWQQSGSLTPEQGRCIGCHTTSAK